MKQIDKPIPTESTPETDTPDIVAKTTTPIDTDLVEVAITQLTVLPGSKNLKTLIQKTATPLRWSHQRSQEREKFRRERAALKRNNFR
jgi:hypothetical protein